MLKQFQRGLLFRVLLLVLFTNALALSAWVMHWYMVTLLLGILNLLLVIDLYRYISKTNADLAKFFFSLRHHDFSINLAGRNSGAHFEELHDELKAVLQISANIKLEQESRFQLLQLLLNEMQSGVLLLDHEHNIVLTNVAFQSQVNAPSCNSLSQLEEHISGISTILEEVKHGRKNFTLNAHASSDVLVSSYTNIQFDTTLHLYVFHKVSDSFETHEMQAWIKLIRILTHEIMNSVTSISSLSATSLEILDETTYDESLHQALSTIKRRCDGLLIFVDHYRRFTDVSVPKKQWITVQSKVDELLALMEHDLGGVEVIVEGDASMAVFADNTHLTHVLQNLFLNAFHALEEVESPKINLSWEQDGNRKTISVKDNGVGISPEKMQEVFVPFYTTREGGSGIGLPLVRQIMQKHGGGVSLKSEEGIYTEAILRFPDH